MEEGYFTTAPLSVVKLLMHHITVLMYREPDLITDDVMELLNQDQSLRVSSCGMFFLCASSSGEPYEFIPLDWLKKWLDDSTATKEIDNSFFLCSHGKLHPDKVGESKRVSLQAGQLLYERYGGGPRLDGSSLCRECVGQRCRVLRLKNQLNEDYKEVSNLVKRTLSGEGYWVGKASLRSWRQLALEQLEEDEHESKHSNGQTNGQGPHTNNCKEFGPELSEGNEEEMKTFNEDIVCSHGGLSILETERKLVSSEVWTKLRVYFPKAPEFTQNQEQCQQCLTLEQEEKDNEAVSKMMALDQKNQLLNLFHEKNRPTLTKWPQDTDVLYIVPLFFVDEWRKFIRRPTKSSPVSNVGNSLLLCPHGGFMFTYDSLINGDAQHSALAQRMGRDQQTLHCGPANLHPLLQTDHAHWSHHPVHHSA